MSVYEEIVEFIERNAPSGVAKKSVYARLEEFNPDVEKKATLFDFTTAQNMMGFTKQIRSYELNIDKHLERIFLTQIVANNLVAYCPSEISIPLPKSFPKAFVNLKKPDEINMFFQDVERRKQSSDQVKAWFKTQEGQQYIQKRNTKASIEREKVLHLNYFKESLLKEPADINGALLRIRTQFQGSVESFCNAWRLAKIQSKEIEFLQAMNQVGCTDICITSIQDWYFSKYKTSEIAENSVSSCPSN